MDTRNANPTSKDSETDLGMRHIPFKPCVEARAGKKDPMCGLQGLAPTVFSAASALAVVSQRAETQGLDISASTASRCGPGAHLAWTPPPPSAGPPLPRPALEQGLPPVSE